MLFLNHSNDYHCQKVGFKSADLSADIWLDNDQIVFWLVSFPRHFTRKCQTFSKYAFYTKSKLDHCHFSANFYFWSLCHIVTISSQFLFRFCVFVSHLCPLVRLYVTNVTICHTLAMVGDAHRIAVTLPLNSITWLAYLSLCSDLSIGF